MLAILCILGIALPVSALDARGGNGIQSTAGTPDVTAHPLRDYTTVSSLPSPQSVTVTPVPVRLTPRETLLVIPVRANRTPLLSVIAKNAVERPRITLPLFWVLILIIAVIATVSAFFYFFFRNRSRTVPVAHAAQGKIPQNATVIDPSRVPGPSGSRASPGVSGPAIPFPPSLEQRFPHAEFIGEGGLARVFRAYDPRLQKTVAVKVPIRYDEVTGTHFTRDIFIWQALHHENIIAMYGSNILPVPYVEMEYAPGSLAQLALPLSQEKALAIITGIARGLAYAHERGVIHRDIKPENILLAEDGTPKITDWGLGREISDMRQSSVLGYSPVYAAPEQISPGRFGRPGPATDIYQLGVLLFELLTGFVPFSDDALHDLSQAILNDPPVVPELPGEYGPTLRTILLRCLEKNPSDRYPTVASFLMDLEHLVDDGDRNKNSTSIA